MMNYLNVIDDKFVYQFPLLHMVYTLSIEHFKKYSICRMNNVCQLLC